MEEVTGSIPVRSTKITSAESKSYSRHVEERNQNKGAKKAHLENTALCDESKNQKGPAG
jgi:hypothetical protein